MPDDKHIIQSRIAAARLALRDLRDALAAVPLAIYQQKADEANGAMTILDEWAEAVRDDAAH